MAHTKQDRFSKLVDVKLRATLVTKDGIIFNNRYEGDPKAGSVKIPVRDTEATVADYTANTGANITEGTTTYKTLTIDKDKAVNELIDGYAAAAVPDNLAADRLDSAGYALAAQIDKDGIACLEAKATNMESSSHTPLTEKTVYASFVDARTKMSKANVPNDGRRWALVSPETYALLLKCPEFIKASDLGDKVAQTGAVGQVAGFQVFEATRLAAKTEYITGHPDWCCRVHEWQVPVHLQDLSGSGKFIGASAVQGRKVYAHDVTKPETLRIKTNA